MFIHFLHGFLLVICPGEPVPGAGDHVRIHPVRHTAHRREETSRRRRLHLVSDILSTDGCDLPLMNRLIHDLVFDVNSFITNHVR